MKLFQLLSTTIISATFATAAIAADPLVLPSGGQITSGSGTINAVTGNTLNIDQSSKVLKIDWKGGFSSSEGANVNFNQKSSDIAINRDISGKASNLFGNLTGAGKIVIINENGSINFGKNSNTNVGSLTAIAGKGTPSPYTASEDFSTTGTSIENHGTINAKTKIEMFANTVSNDGTLSGNATFADGKLVVRPTNEFGNGIVRLNGDNVTNTGTIVADSVALSTVNNMTLIDSNELLNINSGIANKAQTINLGGKITSSETSLSTQRNSVVANSTINLTGIVDSQVVTAYSGGNINQATSLNSVNVTMSANDINLTKDSSTSGTSLNLMAANNINVDGKVSSQFTGMNATNNLTVGETASISANTLSLTANNEIINGNLNGDYTGLNARNDMTFNGNLTGKNINANSGHDFNSSGSIIGKSINIFANNDLNVKANNISTASIYKGEANIDGLLKLEAGRNVNISQGAQVFASNSGAVSQPQLSIKAGNDIISSGKLSASNQYTPSTAGLNALHDITVNGTVVVDNTSLTANNDINLNGKITGKNLGASSNHDINYSAPAESGPVWSTPKNINLTESAKFAAGHDVTLSGNMQTDSITVTSKNDINVNGSLHADYFAQNNSLDVANSNAPKHDKVTLTADHNINLNKGSEVYSQNETGGANITLTAKNDVNMKGYTSSGVSYKSTGKGLTVNATHDINVGAESTTHADGPDLGAQFTAGNDINFNGFIYGDDHFTDKAGVVMNAANNLNTGEHSYIGSDSPIKLTSTKGDINLKGTITNQNQLDIKSGKNLTIGDTGSIYGGANYDRNTSVNLTSAKDTTISGSVHANQDLNITSGTNMNLSGATITDGGATTNAPGYNVTLKSGGSYKDDKDTIVSSDGSNGGTIKITAVTSANVSGNYSADGLGSAYSGTDPLGKGGTITIVAKSFTDTADANFTVNGSTSGGYIGVNSVAATNFRGNYEADGKTKAGVVKLYGGGNSTIGYAKISTKVNSKAVKNVYATNKGIVRNYLGDGK